MFKHIVVAVDGSENAIRAVDQALNLMQDGVELSFVSVIAIDVYSDMVYDPVEAHGDAQRELISAAVDRAVNAGYTPSVTLLHGRPADEIIRYVNASDADLMIMGCRGLNALQEFTIGSVSHKVLKHVDCPVLVVK